MELPHPAEDRNSPLDSEAPDDAEDRNSPLDSEAPDDAEDRSRPLESEAPDDLPGPDVIVIFAAFFESGLAFLSLFVGWWLGQSPLAHFAWAIDDAIWGLLVAIPLVGVFLLIIRRPIGPLRRIKSFCEDEFVPLLAGSSWSDILLISISAGVGEEMLFRGVLQGVLSGWLGDVGGLAVSSILFGLLHPISIPYIVLTIWLGACLGILYLVTGNLLTPMLTHAFYDFMLMAFLLRWQYRGTDRVSIPPVDPDEDIDH
ncbi:CPBP family intramembrane glutamic endopeptidase [Aquisphaera insulae]|uniref:CPBP family intramembrane glutamic endopeptidase n=1 Tax=Aquisphaera insulae TaxID=2712864 RepID=UPI0013ED4A8C|nr:CPBP family intramembrane glutamic endopeptidase [Aquisphaera insulae]